MEGWEEEAIPSRLPTHQLATGEPAAASAGTARGSAQAGEPSLEPAAAAGAVLGGWYPGVATTAP